MQRSRDRIGGDGRHRDPDRQRQLRLAGPQSEPNMRFEKAIMRRVPESADDTRRKRHRA